MQKLNLHARLTFSRLLGLADSYLYPFICFAICVASVIIPVLQHIPDFQTHLHQHLL